MQVFISRYYVYCSYQRCNIVSWLKYLDVLAKLIRQRSIQKIIINNKVIVKIGNQMEMKTKKRDNDSQKSQEQNCKCEKEVRRSSYDFLLFIFRRANCRNNSVIVVLIVGYGREHYFRQCL